MRYLIIGNGLAGTISAQTLRDLDREAAIDLYAEEKHLYYPRPKLIEFLAGVLPEERLFAFPESWYREKNLHVHLGGRVEKIDLRTREVETSEGKKEKYDRLLLANGAHSFVPPIQGAEKRGVFTLRTLDDARAIQDWIKNHPRVVIIGGGLLGLEIARAVRHRGCEVKIVEVFDRLLPRQLDTQGASLLKTQIEGLGIEVRLGVVTKELLGRDRVSGLRFENSDTLEAETAIVAAGVRANISLANLSGIRTDKGVVVDDFLRTSDPHVFAAGDNVQHRGSLYGIIPASFNQARIAAANMAGQQKTYSGTVPSNTLKVVGLDVTSLGLVHPEGDAFEELRKEDKERSMYKKIVLRGGKAVGAIWMGKKQNVGDINRIVSQNLDVSRWKEALLEEDFDFSVL